MRVQFSRTFFRRRITSALQEQLLNDHNVATIRVISSSLSVFWCRNVVFPDRVLQGSVLVHDGRIVSCQPGESLNDAKQLSAERNATFYNLGEKVLSPGLIDVHTHISALGRDWEGYESATRAAAAGGITTLLGMPLNSNPATTTPDAFQQEQEASQDASLFADVGLWGGVVPGNCNKQDLDKLLDTGVFGLKAFLSPLPEAAGFEGISPEQLIDAAKICGKHGKPILVHAELMTKEEWLGATEQAFTDPRSYKAHLVSRPPEWERAAVKVVCEAASYCSMHVVHLSDAGCLPVIQEAKADPNKRLTIETCPHYLLLDSSMINDGETLVKCFPPIRNAANREKLWTGIRQGLIDIVASDHSPCEPSMRCMDTGNMKEAWGGLSGLQYQLPATWTEAVARGFTPTDMAKWWSENPSHLVGIGSKGSLRPGMQADLCWWDPGYRGSPNSYSREYHRWKGTTHYANNESVCGRVLGTWLRGVQVYDGVKDQHLDPVGEFLVSLDH